LKPIIYLAHNRHSRALSEANFDCGLPLPVPCEV
jgi:hypothetical protein